MLSCKANPVLVQCLGFPHSSDPPTVGSLPPTLPPSPALGSPQPLKPRALWLTRLIPARHPVGFCRVSAWLPSALPRTQHSGYAQGKS